MQKDWRKRHIILAYLAFGYHDCISILGAKVVKQHYNLSYDLEVWEILREILYTWLPEKYRERLQAQPKILQFI
jgi:hypothetical protein